MWFGLLLSVLLCFLASFLWLFFLMALVTSHIIVFFLCLLLLTAVFKPNYHSGTLKLYFTIHALRSTQRLLSFYVRIPGFVPYECFVLPWPWGRCRGNIVIGLLFILAIKVRSCDSSTDSFTLIPFCHCLSLCPLSFLCVLEEWTSPWCKTGNLVDWLRWSCTFVSLFSVTYSHLSWELEISQSEVRALVHWTDWDGVVCTAWEREAERHSIDLVTKDVDRVEGYQVERGNKWDRVMEKMNLETFLGSCRAVSLPHAVGDPAPKERGRGIFKEIQWPFQLPSVSFTLTGLWFLPLHTLSEMWGCHQSKEMERLSCQLIITGSGPMTAACHSDTEPQPVKAGIGCNLSVRITLIKVALFKSNSRKI